MTAPGQQATPENQRQATPPVGPPPVAARHQSPQSAVHPLRRLVGNAAAPNKAVRDTVTAVNATLAAGGLEHVAGVPWGYPAALGAVLASAGAVWGSRSHSDLVFGAAVGAGAGGWLALAAETTPWSVGNLAALAVASTGAGLWYGRTRRRSAKLAKFDKQMDAAMKAQAGTKEAQTGWQEIFAAAGCDGVVITSTTPLDGGATGFRIRGRLTKPKFDYAALASSLGAIELTADERTDYPIRPGSIQLMRPKGATAGQFEITVPTIDIFGSKIPHPMNHSPRSIEEAIEMATAADGSRIAVTHKDSAHGIFSGMTDFGKTNFLNCHVFEWTRCTDAATWLMSGSDKSARLLKPLLRAWLKGEIPNPPIDRFAATEDEAMRMLWDARMGIRSRGQGKGIDDDSQKWAVTPDSPRIMIGIEEAGDFLTSDKKHKMPDGKRWTFGQLLLEVIRKARSEAINLVLLTQGGTMDLTGDYGSAIKKQILYRVAFHAQTHTETNACLSTDTSRVELGELDKGEIYVERAGDKRPILALADYIDDGVMDQAARQHYQYAGEVDAETAAAMPFYRDRWTRPEQQEYLASLMGMSVENITATAEDGSQQGGAVDDPLSDLDEFADSDDTAAYSQRMNDLLEKYSAEVEASVAKDEVEELERAVSGQNRTLGDLDGETLRMIGVIQNVTEDEIPAEDLRARIADQLGLEDNTETDRKVNAAVKDILGVADLDETVKRRRTIEGQKRFVWNVAAIKEAIRDMGR